MLHLAEVRAWPDRPGLPAGAPLLVDGERQWVSYMEPPTGDMTHFLDLGTDLIASGTAKRAKIGSADTLVLGAKELVDLAVARWRDLPPQV